MSEKEIHLRGPCPRCKEAEEKELDLPDKPCPSCHGTKRVEYWVPLSTLRSLLEEDG